MADALRDLPRVCPYLHLPFQSGLRPGPGLDAAGLHAAAVPRHGRRCSGTACPTSPCRRDVIVGYPGETEAEFEETLRVLETVGFDGLFTFAYSPRPGTTALRLPDDVPEDEKKRRLHVVNAHQQQWQRRRNEALRRERRGGPGRDASTGEAASRAGRPTSGSSTSTAHDDLVGQFVTVEITGAGPELPAGPPFASGSLTGSSARSYILPEQGGRRRVEIEMAIKGLMVDPITNMPIVVLREAEGQRVLPIWVGVFEANAIALQVENVQTPRPMTHDLLKTVIDQLGGRVERIVVCELKENTFYATLHVLSAKGLRRGRRPALGRDRARAAVGGADLRRRGGHPERTHASR